MATPRQGPLGRMYHIREASWNVDPTTPTIHLMPLHAQEQFRTDQPREQAVVYEGTFQSKGSYKGPIDASGDREMSMDYKYVGYDLMDILGSAGYSRVGTLHRWTSLDLPLPYQLQKEYTQSTAIIHRYPGIFATLMRVAGAVSGQQMYTISQLGKGGEARAAISGATPTDILERKGYSTFDGSILKGTNFLANVSAFNFSIDRKVTPKEGYYAAGERAAVSFGTPLIEGDLGLIFTTEDGDTFYDEAINDTVVTLSCLFANKPLVAGPTKFLRFWMDAVLFSRTEPGVGGDQIPDQTQHFIAQLPDSGVYHPATAIGTVLGPYVFTGSNNVVSVKFEGGSTIDVVIATGTKTAAQVAALLNVDAGFLAKGKAYDLNGRLEIRSLDTTLSSSVQWQTATANSAHTLMGFDTTTWTGYAPSELYVELFNDVSANYA